ncbi:hypothetical protein C2G38_1956200, partial [Gigaspora rosea]
YDPKNLPLRTHKDYLLNIAAIECLNGSSRKREFIYFLGINGRSVLLELKSIKFFDSFPVDIMYSLFKNIAPAILRHWSGLFFKDNQLSNSEYTIPNSVWTNIRKVIDKNKKNMP